MDSSLFVIECRNATSTSFAVTGESFGPQSSYHPNVDWVPYVVQLALLRCFTLLWNGLQHEQVGQ